MLTESFDSVNFCVKLSSVGTVDVVDVVRILCVCSVVGRCRVRSKRTFGFESQDNTNQIKYDYYEKVHHLSDSIRFIVIAINMVALQFTVTSSRPFHYRTNKSVNVSVILSTN